MREEMLFEVLSDINDRYIIDAHGNQKRSFGWKRWTAAAACFVMIAVVSVPAAENFFEADNMPVEEDIQGTIVNNAIQELQAEIEYSDREEASAGEQEDDLFVINEVDSIVSADMDVEFTFYDKLPEYVRRQILDEFQEFTGISYEDFVARIPNVWEYVNFYSLSTRGYKDADLSAEYRLHDYVFEYRTAGDGEATIALCTFEAPLRDCFIVNSNPEKSKINGVSLTIYGHGGMYMVEFSYENVNYDIETKNVTMDELKNLLTGILDTTDQASNNVKSSASNSDIEEVPADGNGSYMEAVHSNDLTKEVSEFFGGSYIDDNGKFVVVLTEDTAENRAAICKELGISETGTVFKTGSYTLSYLTELQDKISNAMINNEIPFVVTSGVYETINRIKISVTTKDEAELAKVYALDTIGGAIEVEYTTGAMQELLAPEVETAN